jgi:hypothetical protein
MWRFSMRIAYAVATVSVLAMASPAYAEQYFIVKEKDGKTCTIVKEKPTDETMVLIDEDGVVYTTEVEAQEGMKKTKICVENEE